MDVEGPFLCWSGNAVADGSVLRCLDAFTVPSRTFGWRLGEERREAQASGASFQQGALRLSAVTVGGFWHGMW